MINNNYSSQNFGSIRHLSGGKLVKTITGRQELEMLQSFQSLPKEAINFYPAKKVREHDTIEVFDRNLDKYEITDDALKYKDTFLARQIIGAFNELKMRANNN